MDPMTHALALRGLGCWCCGAGLQLPSPLDGWKGDMAGQGRKEKEGNSTKTKESQQAGSTLAKGTKRGFNSLVMLGAWMLWKERNDIVFNGASPRIERLLLLAQEEAVLWRLAGAKGISDLVAARPGV
ncbi:hypothetical protein SETIT_9G474500v2 [Setaria italica]|uniref:Uncharacterized protein n=1 Tax=Setaria italica TaxID=4555 RepID=A0A368STD5_SETIT|nr:hypothetical protein SETIT_9G474500v2 [Setaria italica]